MSALTWSRSGLASRGRAQQAVISGAPPWRLLVLAMALLLLLTAIGVVYAKHRNRVLYTELQRLHAQRDQINVEWGQLQLEQATWSSHSRIEREARDGLKMKQPLPKDVQVIVRGTARGRP